MNVKKSSQKNGDDKPGGNNSFETEIVLIEKLFLFEERTRGPTMGGFLFLNYSSLKPLKK